ncbi:MAG: 2-dehydropantoate 2-reductase [Candidatus Eremiobacteraeota bacterium]|nr:2-dehydropantoate 2-reductase [Candidatus Eremiobacteraeota bacterium]MBV8355560.1 2-dehydropantoate 2-reductase [Candidatus Eremiobacteraeota bacterium]
MQITVIGAGAMGGLLGAKLSLAGHQVTFIVRNPAYIAAIEANGLQILSPEGNYTAHGVAVTDDYAKPGSQDLVILAVKAHQMKPIIGKIGRLFGPQTIVMTVQNGIPWWYFHKTGGPFEGRRIEAVDPDGAIDAAIPAQLVIGCVAYPAGEVVAPGVIKHVEGNRFSVGELDGEESLRVGMLAQILIGAGFKSYVLQDIRSEIWLKLWGNLSFNPISALTHATLVDICRFPLTRELAAEMMREAQAIASKLGITFRVTIEKRIEGAESVGAHKTSMLQDVEAGRALEVEALLGAVVELGRLTETPIPHIETVYALVKLLDKTMAQEKAGFASVAPATAAAAPVTV